MNVSSASIDLAIVMPAYNEEACIAQVIANWLALLSELPGVRANLVVVDDGSKDRTGEILDQCAARDGRMLALHQPNGGHGQALLTGYRQALDLGPQWVFQVDSDDQFHCADFKQLWQQRERSPFILGCRQKRRDPLIRLLITRVLRLVNLLLFGCDIKDANIPFRLMKAAYLKALLEVLPPNLFAPNIFLAVLAARDGQDLMYLPVTHIERKSGQISIVRLKLLKVCLRSLGELCKFRRSLAASLERLKQLTPQ